MGLSNCSFTISTSCYISTDGTAYFIKLSSKAPLETHIVGIKEWKKEKNVIMAVSLIVQTITVVCPHAG